MRRRSRAAVCRPAGSINGGRTTLGDLHIKVTICTVGNTLQIISRLRRRTFFPHRYRSARLKPCAFHTRRRFGAATMKTSRRGTTLRAGRLVQRAKKVRVARIPPPPHLGRPHRRARRPAPRLRASERRARLPDDVARLSHARLSILTRPPRPFPAPPPGLLAFPETHLRNMAVMASAAGIQCASPSITRRRGSLAPPRSRADAPRKPSRTARCSGLAAPSKSRLFPFPPRR